jgi:hypothetical protein
MFLCERLRRNRSLRYSVWEERDNEKPMNKREFHKNKINLRLKVTETRNHIRSSASSPPHDCCAISFRIARSCLRGFSQFKALKWKQIDCNSLLQSAGVIRASNHNKVCNPGAKRSIASAVTHLWATHHMMRTCWAL